MTVLQAITRADLDRPNEVPAERKLQWLSTLDGRIDRELFQRFDGAPPAFSGYGPETELQTAELLVGFPFDDLYLRYLVLRIDLEQGELERYNNDAAAFNRIWQSYAAHYGRTHTPVGVRRLTF